MDDPLTVIGRTRRVGMVVASFLLVPELVCSSDMIALVPSRAIVGAAGRDSTTLEPPLALDEFTLHLAWHRRREQDRAVRFVAGEIRRLLAEPLA